MAVNTVLTALEISIKHICDKGATALSKMLAVNTVLTALVLENNSIRDAGATELSNALATNAVLTELDLCCNSSRALRGCDRAVTTLAINSALMSLDVTYIFDEIATMCRSVLSFVLYVYVQEVLQYLILTE